MHLLICTSVAAQVSFISTMSVIGVSVPEHSGCVGSWVCGVGVAKLKQW